MTIALGGKPGHEDRAPDGIVIVGGLATSTLLGLVLLPARYVRIARPRTEAT
jgi:multidrug efflux pump subunit AcrB